MVKKSRGFRVNTRRKLRQKSAYKPPITKFLEEFKIGENVVIDHEPSSHKGMPFPRFKGRVGKVVEKRGKSYVIEVKDGKMIKYLISRPEHLKRV